MPEPVEEAGDGTHCEQNTEAQRDPHHCLCNGA